MPCATRNPGDAGPFPLRRDGTEPRGRPSQPEGRPHVGHERSARSSPAEPAQSLGGGVIVDAEMLSDRADGAARGVHLRRRRGDPLIDGRRGRVAERDLDRHPGESASVYLPRPPASDGNPATAEGKPSIARQRSAGQLPLAAFSSHFLCQYAVIRFESRPAPPASSPGACPSSTSSPIPPVLDGR